MRAWTFQEALTLCAELELALFVKNAHVALTGSVLQHGFSQDDLDVVIYPRKTYKPFDVSTILDSVRGLGFNQVCVAEDYAKDDDKLVITCYRLGKKLDLFFPSKSRSESPV